MKSQPLSWRGAYTSYRFCGHAPTWSAWRACCYLCGKPFVRGSAELTPEITPRLKQRLRNISVIKREADRP